ncbi:MFS transporter [Ancrocorticia populi]|uniref:MFS transporter n=3 Tax=Ancrocorticia populi TaxID=2175228 RepID=A0A2V1KA55_9ACTO|nr:MFS transporter [Ancrocorticia populi]PWF27190.1 MFS transporter [Ancrocorticia populi]
MGRTFASLKYYNYRVWFFCALVANTGTWMQRVAQDWLVLAVLTEDSSFAVGLVTALQFVPMLFFMPFAGAVADRFDKRKILYCTQSLQGLLAFGLGAMVLLDAASVWHVCLFAFALGTVGAFDGPPRLVFISELVPPRSLPNAVGLNSTSFNIARLIGPALSGVLIAWVGIGWVFIINGFSFVFTLFALSIMRPSEYYRASDKAADAQQDTSDSPAQPAEKSKRPKGQVREGLKYVLARSDLRVIFIVTGVVSCLGMNFQLTSASMARVVFGLEADGYGFLGSILAIGSLTGALFAARRQTQPRVRVVVMAAFAFAIAASLNALMPTFPLYAVSLVLVGLTMLTLLTSANTAVQMSTDPRMRGRVMALYQTVMQGSTPIGALLVGWISEALSPRWGVGIGAISAFLVVAGAYIWGRRTWDVQVRYHLRSRPHFDIRGPLEHERDAAVETAQDQINREIAQSQGDKTPGDHAR